MDGALCYPTILAVVKVVVFLSLCNEFFSFVPLQKTKKPQEFLHLGVFFFLGQIYIYILDSPN